MPEDVPSNHEIFAPRLGPIRVRRSGPKRSGRCSPGCRPGARTGASTTSSGSCRARGAASTQRPCSPAIWSLPDRAAHTDRLAADQAPSKAWASFYQVDHERLRLTWVTDKTPVSPMHDLPAHSSVLRPRRLPCAWVVRDPRAVRPAAGRTRTATTTGRLPLDARRSAEGNGAHRSVGKHRGGRDPAAVHPRRDQRLVVLHDLRARRRRRRAAGGDASQHAAEHGQLSSAGRPCRPSSRVPLPLS